MATLAKLLRRFVLIGAVVLTQGCTNQHPDTGGQGPVFVNTLPNDTTNGTAKPQVRGTSQSIVTARSETLASIASMSGSVKSSDDYHVAPLDILDVSVFRVPELTKTVQVSATGQIGFPLIGVVGASGKTTSELEGEIARKLEEKYLQSPEVSVSVKEAISERVTVGGAVKEPGVFPIRGPTTLLQGIALAHGTTDLADTSEVLVFRTANGQRLAAKFDVASIGTGHSADPTLKGGDIVMVDESGVRSTLHALTQDLQFFAIFTPLLLL